MKINAGTIHVAIATLIGSLPIVGPNSWNFSAEHRRLAANELLRLLNHAAIEIEAVEDPDGG